jgi:hypothetical protein
MFNIKMCGAKELLMQTVFSSQPNSLRMIITLVILMIILLQPGLSQSVSGSESVTSLPQLGLAPAVIYKTQDGHIHEIVLKGTWQHRDLTTAAGAPIIRLSNFSQPKAFQRSDGVSMVIYRGEDFHIYAIYLELSYQGNNWKEVWHWADLNDITGSPPAVSDPFGYVRSDGISTVVYIGSDDHIHELRLEGGWIWADLTAIASAPIPNGNYDVVAYVRGDGISTIVYTGFPDSHIYELRLENGWKWADLTDLSGAPPQSSPLSAYVRSDGISTINFTAGSILKYRVQDLRLENGWICSDLTGLSGAPGAGYYSPSGYVRSDGINAIVFENYETHKIYELRLDNGWQYYELTSVPNAVQGYSPVGYVRADGISAVVYKGIDYHIQEIRLEQDGWHWADLTSIAEAPAAFGNPWPYNRSVFVSLIYLPLIER